MSGSGSGAAAAAAPPALLSTKTFFLDNFALRQWDDPNYGGTRVSYDKAAFIARIQEEFDKVRHLQWAERAVRLSVRHSSYRIGRREGVLKAPTWSVLLLSLHPTPKYTCCIHTNTAELSQPEASIVLEASTHQPPAMHACARPTPRGPRWWTATRPSASTCSCPTSWAPSWARWRLRTPTATCCAAGTPSGGRRSWRYSRGRWHVGRALWTYLLRELGQGLRGAELGGWSARGLRALCWLLGARGGEGVGEGCG